MRTFLRAAVACALTFVAFLGPVAAQTAASGTVTGQVTGDNGTGISNASVLFASGSQHQTIMTNDAGSFNVTLPPGLYTVTVVKGGYQTGTSDVAVVAGSGVTVNVSLSPATLNNLNVIGRTVSSGSGNAAKFNISSSSTASLSAQQILIREQPELTEAVNELPGMTIVHGPTSNVNEDFIIRGLKYETQVTLDGHPVSSGTFGTFLTNYANAAIFGGVDVVKGGSLNGPISGEAAAGIVNLRTPDFTSKDSGFLQAGLDNYGGTYYTALADVNLLPNDKLSLILGRTFSGYRGPTFGLQEPDYYGSTIPTTGTGAAPALANGLVQYVSDFSDTYSLNAELAKMRYKFSDATSLSLEFLGLQGRYDPQGGAYGQYAGQLTVPQCLTAATNVAASGAACTPTSKYNSPAAQSQIGQTIPIYSYYPGSDVRYNQPNFSADFKTTIGNDTLLFRPYSVSINNLQDGTQEVDVPGADSTPGGWYQVTSSLNCQVTFVAPTAAGAKGPCYAADVAPGAAYVTDPSTPHSYATTTNSLTCTVAAPCYTTATGVSNSGTIGFGSPYTTLELDHLFGYTFSYIHPVGANTYNLSFDHYFDDTTAYSNDASPLAPGCSFTYSGGTQPVATVQNPTALGYQPSCNLPGGALRPTPVSVPETFASVSSLGLSAQLQLTPNLEADLGGYFTHYLINAQQENPALLQQYAAAGVQNLAPIDFIPSYNSASHFDPRFGLVFRPEHDWALRFSAGSAMTIPYASLVSGSLSYAQTSTSTTVSTPNYGLAPEESVTLDLGSDYRTPDGTVMSGDIYNIVIHNPWIATKVFLCNCVPAGLEGQQFYSSQTLNGAQEYAQGIEFAIANEPAVGFGYRATSSFERNYFLDTPPAYLATPGVFYNGAQLQSSGNFVAIPYTKGYAEMQYAGAHGQLVRLGADYEGPNNSYNAPAFWLFDAGARINTGFHDVLLGISAENLFNLNFNALLARSVRAQGAIPIAATATATGYSYSALSYTNLVAPLPFTVRFSLSKRF